MEYKEQSFAAAMEICSESEQARVVHAWIPGGPGYVVHAWAEIEDAVYDLTISEHPFARDIYYAKMQVDENLLRRYGRVEYFTLMADTGSLGPFDTTLFFANQTTDRPQP